MDGYRNALNMVVIYQTFGSTTQGFGKMGRMPNVKGVAGGTFVSTLLVTL